LQYSVVPPQHIIGRFGIMKHTTKKVLLWLYQIDKEAHRVASVDDLRLLLPELKNSGFRSLLNLLKKQSLISREEKGKQTIYRLTSYGESLLEADFPLFSNLMSDWSGQWTMIVFRAAPKSDKQFRYLRKFLIDEHCGQLARGVYLYPGELPSSVSSLLLKLYVGAVLVTGISEWSFGDERSLVSNIFGLNDLKSGYSGISKEIYQLLKQKNKLKGLRGGDNSSVCLAFDRLLSLLSTDLGLLHHYHPESKSGGDLLLQLQELL
jgi:DNA-binding transcriptional regulator PaaX